MRWSACVLLVVAVLCTSAHAAVELPRVEAYAPEGYTADLQVAETNAPTPAPPTGNIFDKFLAAFMNNTASGEVPAATPTPAPSNDAGESGTPPSEPSTGEEAEAPAEEQTVPGDAETTNAPAPAPEGEGEGEEATAPAPAAEGEPNHGGVGDVPADLEAELEAVDAEEGAGHLDGDPNVTDGLAGEGADAGAAGEQPQQPQQPEQPQQPQEPAAESEQAAPEGSDNEDVVTTQPTDGDGMLPATPAGSGDAAPAGEGEAAPTPTTPGVPTTRVRAPPMPAGVGKGKAVSQNAADYAAQAAYKAEEDNNKLAAGGFDLMQGGAAASKAAWDVALPTGELRFAKDVTNVPTPKAADNPALAKPNAPDAPLPAGPGVDTASHGFHDADDRMIIPPQHVVPPQVKIPEEAKPSVAVPRMNLVDGSQVLQGAHTEVAPETKPRVTDPSDAPLPGPVKLAPTLGKPQPMTKDAYTFQSPYVEGEGDDEAAKPKYDWSYPDARYTFGASAAEDASKEATPATQPVKVPAVVPGVAPAMPQVPDVKVPEPPTIPATPHFNIPKENDLNLPLLSKRVA